MYGIYPLKTNILVAMAHKGFNQKTLSENTGLSPSTVSNIINGVYSASPITAKKIASCLSVNFEEIFSVTCEKTVQ